MNQFEIVCNKCDNVVVYIKGSNPIARDIAKLKLHAQTCRGTQV